MAVSAHYAPTTELVVTASRENIPPLRRAMIAAARDAGVGPATCERIALAVSEAATNAVIHAFGDGAPGCIRATLDAQGTMLEVAVSDNGQGLVLRNDSPGLGMGLGIIDEVADRMEIGSQPGEGTAIRMWFSR